MGYNFRPFRIILVAMLFSTVVFSQNKYSENALTGNGDLELIGSTHKLQNDAFKAFKLMRNAAAKEGIAIEIVSAYRSFNRQKNIWNKKYTKYTSQGLPPKKAIEKIIEYSTIPGTSRHHWGTDIDIIDGSVPKPKTLLVEANFKHEGVYSKLKKWMDENSEKFGFYLVYDNNLNRKGFKYEPWHYSYKPLSQPMLNQFLKLDIQKFYKLKFINGKRYLTKKMLSNYYEENILTLIKV